MAACVMAAAVRNVAAVPTMSAASGEGRATPEQNNKCTKCYDFIHKVPPSALIGGSLIQAQPEGEINGKGYLFARSVSSLRSALAATTRMSSG